MHILLAKVEKMQNVKQAKVGDKNSDQERVRSYFAWEKEDGRHCKSSKSYCTSSIKDSLNLLAPFKQALKSW